MNPQSPLYETYVESHMEHVRDPSIAGIQRAKRIYRYYFGPLLNPDREDRILDLGCGYGAFVHFLQSEGYQNVDGIDVSPQQIALADKLGIQGVVCVSMDSFLLKRPKFYDSIIAIDVIDHIPKAELLPSLKMIFNGLKPGGRLILQAVNGASPFSGRMRYGDFTHEFALTATSASQVLRSTGFCNISVHSTKPYAHGLRSLMRRLMWNVASFFIWVCLVCETGELRGHILTQNLIVIAERPKELDPRSGSENNNAQ